jgi:DNA-binding XRE family transcriptional regulator
MIRPQQVRAARALLGWPRERLAKAAGVGASTIKAFENETTDTRLSIARAIEAALVKAGVVFLEPDQHGGPGVRLRK